MIDLTMFRSLKSLEQAFSDVAARRSKKQDESIAFINILLEHSKEMQIHIRGIRTKAILGCGIFAAAVAGFLIDKYPVAAILFFLLLSGICWHIDSGHRKLLYKWRLTHLNLQKLSVTYLCGGILEVEKLDNIIQIPITSLRKLGKAKIDYASRAVVAFFIFSAFISTILVFSDEEIYNEFIEVRNLAYNLADYFSSDSSADPCVANPCPI